MKKKLLIKLILEDVKILEELVSSFDENANNHEEIDIALNRARSVIKELELLSKNISPASQQPAEKVEKTPSLHIASKKSVVKINHIKPETLGESFANKKQLINDLHEKGGDGNALMNSPLRSIREGIGLNDRFLYIRELFDNNKTKYEEALETIEQCNTSNEAISYLNEKFSWDKSETNEKFLSLIKRKFTK
jgi:hypothetical protein